MLFNAHRDEKGRSGHVCTILCTTTEQTAVMEALFTHSTTFGCRYSKRSREILHRCWDTVVTDLGTARMKIGHQGNILRQMSVEFEDAKRLAKEHNLPIATVMTKIQQAHWQQFPNRYRAL